MVNLYSVCLCVANKYQGNEIPSLIIPRNIEQASRDCSVFNAIAISTTPAPEVLDDDDAQYFHFFPSDPTEEEIETAKETSAEAYRNIQVWIITYALPLLAVF